MSPDKTVLSIFLLLPLTQYVAAFVFARTFRSLQRLRMTLDVRVTVEHSSNNSSRSVFADIAKRHGIDDIPDEMILAPIVPEVCIVLSSLNWHLNIGGRLDSFHIGHESASAFDDNSARSIGFEQHSTSPSCQRKCVNVDQLLLFCADRAQHPGVAQELRFMLHNMLGRLHHGEKANPELAIAHYTEALSLVPDNATTFRNLGSAYHAAGNLQLAFASYQQAIQLDPADALVYLKLGYLYEELAAQQWGGAEAHATQCYEYYLANHAPGDISALTRLANLLAQHHPAEAIAVYEKIHSIDASCLHAWYNKAIAQMKIGDFDGAQVSYERALQLHASLPVAKHMVQALAGGSMKEVDPEYIIEHFDSVAHVYDKRMKVAQYATPRMIRQELSMIYRQRQATGAPDSKVVTDVMRTSRSSTAISDAGDAVNTRAPAMTNECHPSERSFMYGALSVLDLGCGTGLVGAWLREYAHHLSGVDISPGMLKIAANKHLYDKLYHTLLQDFLTQHIETYDLVIAAGVLAFVGNLEVVLSKAAGLLRPQGLLVFTFELPMSYLGSDGAQELPYQLARTGTVVHSEEYIRELVHQLGPDFSILMYTSFNASRSAEGPVAEKLVMLQRN